MNNQRHINKIKKLLLALCLTVTVSFTAIYSWYKYQFIHLKNFDVIVPHTIYRSGQPTKDSFKEWQSKYQFKSILNLRGNEYCKSEPKSLEFIEYAKKLDLNSKYIAISSKKMPYPKQVKEIIDFIKDSPKPLLIHCKHGVDRTGLISAIAVILNDEPLSNALYQISLFKGFLPFRHHEILKIFLYDYENWLFNSKLDSSSKNFIYWVDNVYSVKYFPNKYRSMKSFSFLTTDDWPELLQQMKTSA